MGRDCSGERTHLLVNWGWGQGCWDCPSTSIPALIGRQATDEEIETLVTKCSRGGKITIGAMEVLTSDDMAAIYRMANR